MVSSISSHISQGAQAFLNPFANHGNIKIPFGIFQGVYSPRQNIFLRQSCQYSSESSRRIWPYMKAYIIREFMEITDIRYYQRLAGTKRLISLRWSFEEAMPPIWILESKANIDSFLNISTSPFEFGCIESHSFYPENKQNNRLFLHRECHTSRGCNPPVPGCYGVRLLRKWWLAAQLMVL